MANRACPPQRPLDVRFARAEGSIATGPAGPGATGPEGDPGPGIVERNPRITVRLATTLNIANLSNTSTTIDGVAMGSGCSGHAILVGNAQTTASERGVYLCTYISGTSMSLTRVADFDPHMLAGDGLYVYVRQGTAGNGLAWNLSGNAPTVVTSTTPTGKSPIDIDAEDFWLPAHGDDYSPSFHLAQRAMQMSVCFGRFNWRRRSAYNHATPLWVTNGLELAGKSAPYRGTGTTLTFAGAGFLVASVPIGVGVAGVLFRDLDIVGPSSTAGGDQHGIVAHQAVRFENVRVRQFPGRDVWLRGKTSDAREDLIATPATTTGGFTMPAVGATTTVTVDNVTALRVGTPIYIPTAGQFRIEAINTLTLTIYNNGLATDTAYITKNATPGTVITTAKVLSGCFSNVDHSGCANLRCETSGLSGFYIEGDNANQGVFSALDCSSCGQRRVTGDHHGRVDDTFLGNSYPGFHGATNTYNTTAVTTLTAGFTQPRLTGSGSTITGKTITLNVASSAGFVAGQVFIIEVVGIYKVVTVPGGGLTLTVNCLRHLQNYPNAGDVVPTAAWELKGVALAFLDKGINARTDTLAGYTESSDAGQNNALSFLLGGRMGNLSEGHAIVPSSGYLDCTPMRWTAGGPNDVWIEAGGGSSTDRYLRFGNFVDTSGWEFKLNATTKVNEFANVSGTKVALYFTQSDHTFYDYFCGTSRFLLNGVRMNFFSVLAGTASPPGTSTATEPYYIGNLGFISDKRGPWCNRVTDKSGSTLTNRIVGQVPLNDDSVALPDSTSTLQPASNSALTTGDGYHHQVTTGTPQTANRTTTLGVTNCFVGSLWTITKLDRSRFTRTLTNGGGGGGNPAVLPGGCESQVTLRFDGTNWVRVTPVVSSNPVSALAQNYSLSAALALAAGQTVTGQTLTGIVLGDALNMAPATALPAGILYSAIATGDNTYKIQVYNAYGGATEDLSAVTWNVTKALQ